jgi:hypothetical protein
MNALDRYKWSFFQVPDETKEVKKMENGKELWGGIMDVSS